jgi:hypothetical protein
MGYLKKKRERESSKTEKEIGKKREKELERGRGRERERCKEVLRAQALFHQSRKRKRKENRRTDRQPSTHRRNFFHSTLAKNLFHPFLLCNNTNIFCVYQRSGLSLEPEKGLGVFVMCSV